MELYGSFEEKGYRVDAFLDGGSGASSFLVRFYNSATNELIKEARVEMYHDPVFGVDIEDHEKLEDETNRLLSELEAIA
ncbi:MAG: hypothetical protein HY367_03615 [Candidatus Aenigmarchaeota archaeon]|nr:hypothetical protein [Candidatus Aenigmarchaeota archaeon]